MGYQRNMFYTYHMCKYNRKMMEYADPKKKSKKQI